MMKTTIKTLALGMLAAFGILLQSCGDDDPVVIIPTFGFENGAIAVDENAGQSNIAVDFSSAIPVDVAVDLQVAGTAVYGEDYTTVPAVEGGILSISVEAAAESASFIFVPVDNGRSEGDRTVTFTLGDVEGLTLGEITSVTLTIVDDETPSTDIASIRALYDGSEDVEITEATKVEGIVISNDEAMTTQNLIVQDGTGGIVLRFTEDHSYAQGDEVAVTVTGATISDFNDLVQISGALELTAASKIADGTLPSPQVVTLDQLNSDAYQSQLVTIENVSFLDADGSSTLSGNNDVTDGTSTSIVRVSSGASFADELAPFGTGNVTGVAGIFRGDAQLLPQNFADIFVSMPAGEIAISGTLDNFGEVANGAVSAEQSYMIMGSSLENEVMVSASSNFEISKVTGAEFGSSLTFTAAEANAGVTVYVRFVANSGFNQVINGTINHQSTDVVAVGVSVTGEETGNDAVSTPQDLFFSEYVEGSSNNKYLEIFNGTGNPIDLSDYQINRYGNGAGLEDASPYPLQGTLNSGEVIVIANSQAALYDGTLYDATDVNGATFYNGDDVVALLKISSNSLIDIIGQIGCDPGSNWTDGDHSMANKTLRRKSTVNSGVSVNPTGECGPTSFPTMITEWDVFDIDDVSGLGSHTFSQD